jgi:hypothetical protein
MNIKEKILSKVLDKNNNVSASKLRSLDKETIDIIKQLSKCPSNNIVEKLYWLINDLDDYPKKCLTCNSPIKIFSSFKDGYLKSFCCLSCMQKHPETIKKKKQTIKNRYGVNSIWQVDFIKWKRDKTNIERYGVVCPVHNNQIKEKVKNTFFKKYGVKTNIPSQVKKFNKKRIETQKKTYIENIILKNSNIIEPLFSISDYIKNDNYKKELLWKCLTCKYEFYIQPYEHIFCPRCYPKCRSQLQNKIADELKKINLSIELDVRKPLDNRYEIDIFVRDKKLGIEINGNYWHSELNGIDKFYHKNKLDFALENCITLLNFFEDEVLYKHDIVLSMIKSKLNLYKTIYARNTKIVELGKNETDIFLENTHIQGTCKYDISYGLNYNDEIVCVITFVKPRYNKNYEWEIARFSSKLNTKCIGGFSKLLKHFIKLHKPKNIISYSDKRYSIGDVYIKNGFKKSHTSQPNYWYMHKSNYLIRLNRQNFQKHKLKNLLTTFNENLTEWENMKNNGYDRIWDCGNDVFILNT